MFREHIIFLSALLILHDSSGSELHGPCETNGECGTFDSYCRNGTCACIKNFMAMHDSCVQMSPHHKACKRKDECHHLLGPKSICRETKCVCKPFHHIYKGQCVKNRELFINCEFDHQCYCGQDCWHGMVCINATCTCKLGYRPSTIGRKCIAYHPSVILSSQHVDEQPEKQEVVSSAISYTKSQVISLIITTINVFLFIPRFLSLS